MRQRLESGIQVTIQPIRRKDLPSICDQLGLPPAPDDPALSKADYLKSRYPKTDDGVLESSHRFVEEFPLSEGHAATFDLEEELWATEGTAQIPRKVRHEIAHALETEPLFSDGRRFLIELSHLFYVKSPLDALEALFGRSSNPIVQHMLDNDDWTAWQLFEHLGAFEVSDRRFARLLETLTLAEVHNDESRQRTVAATINEHL